ncbi:MAG: alpha/beta fold hydrolase [Gemmataceae bacterium]|nr:alpha/beta fold hydrolase [Gemmataceae bacterium]
MRPLLLALLIAAPAQAQFFGPATRHELAQRLKMFESALEKHKGDRKAVERAVPIIAPATAAFFAGDAAKVARLLDTARLSLESEKPDEAKAWASSWRFTLKKRVGDPKEGDVEVRVERLYKMAVGAPESAKVSLMLATKTRGVVTTPAEFPKKAVLFWGDCQEGDHKLVCTIDVGEKELFRTEQTFSLISDFDARLKKMDKSDPLGKKTVEAATLAHHLGILKALAKGEALETDYPAHRLLVEAEAIAAGKWDPKAPGQYWLALPGVAGSPVRLAVPKQAKAGKPLPVVVALHGAGGSENMFFDAYGNGLVAKLGLERGWFVVATRGGFFGPDVPAVLDALAKLHSIDPKRVFVVGHSMGAAQAVALAGRKPERYAAVAALGGGGTFKEGDGLKKVPFFVGAGKLDFALKSAERLAKSLEKAGAATAFKEYPHIEHLAVVQWSLPEVFAFFDKATAPR